MRQEVYERVLYEPGDIVNPTKVQTRYSIKKRIIEKSKRALVLSVVRKKGNSVSYTLISDKGEVFNLNESESMRCEHLGQIDISLLFEEEEEKG